MMANNRMRFVGVDDNGEIKKELYFAKHFGGEWYVSLDDLSDHLDKFFFECFIQGLGIGLIDEFTDEPLNVVYHYNDAPLKDNHGEIVRCGNCKYFYCLTIDACVCTRNKEKLSPWVAPNGFCAWAERGDAE